MDEDNLANNDHDGFVGYWDKTRDYMLKTTTNDIATFKYGNKFLLNNLE